MALVDNYEMLDLTRVRHIAHHCDMAIENPGGIPPLTLGWRLKMALGDMPRSEMAANLGVDPGTLSRWMADKGAPPRVAYLKQWALATRTNYDWLATGQGKMPLGPTDECAMHDSNVQPTDWEDFGANQHDHDGLELAEVIQLHPATEMPREVGVAA